MHYPTRQQVLQEMEEMIKLIITILLIDYHYG